MNKQYKKIKCIPRKIKGKEFEIERHVLANCGNSV